MLVLDLNLDLNSLVAGCELGVGSWGLGVEDWDCVVWG